MQFRDLCKQLQLRVSHIQLAELFIVRLLLKSY